MLLQEKERGGRKRRARKKRQGNEAPSREQSIDSTPLKTKTTHEKQYSSKPAGGEQRRGGDGRGGDGRGGDRRGGGGGQGGDRRREDRRPTSGGGAATTRGEGKRCRRRSAEFFVCFSLVPRRSLNFLGYKTTRTKTTVVVKTVPVPSSNGHAAEGCVCFLLVFFFLLVADQCNRSRRAISLRKRRLSFFFTRARSMSDRASSFTL